MKRTVSLMNRQNENIKLNAIEYGKLKLGILQYKSPYANCGFACRLRINQKYLAHRRHGHPWFKLTYAGLSFAFGCLFIVLLPNIVSDIHISCLLL